MKRILSVLLVGILILNLFPQTLYAAGNKLEGNMFVQEREDSEDGESVDTFVETFEENIITAALAGEGPEVTRLEWLKALTGVFRMSVEEDNYPDNYYSDVEASSPDYHDIMLATEFGLVDVEAGEALRPDDPAEREFAAHTLNLCLGYLPEENVTYTFSEADRVAYRDDIQIAIDQGWLTLEDGNFLPEAPITLAEKDAMIAIAQEAVAATVVDYNYDGYYQVLEGVIVVPEDTQAVLTGENELTLYQCNTEIPEGSIFVVVSGGLPIAKRALGVSVMGDRTVVQVESVEMEDAFADLDVQGSLEADVSQAQAMEDQVSLTYIVGGTEEKDYEDGVVYHSKQAVGNQKVSAVVATKTILPEAGIGRGSDLAKGGGITVKCKISNVSADFSTSVKEKKVYLKISATVTFSCSIATDSIKFYEHPFVKVPIGAIGYFAPSAEGTVSGSISVVQKGKISMGLLCTSKGISVPFEYQKEAFTVSAQVEAQLGIKVAIGIGVGPAKAELYAKAGAKAAIKKVQYKDGQRPTECRHFTAHLYASVGGTASVKFFDILKFEAEIAQDIYTEKNSPVKVALHNEDGQPVDRCSRDHAGGGGSGGGGSSAGNNYNYYTPWNSQYAYSGANTGVSSSGERYTIFEYDLDEENQAIITKYNGNVSALIIPETIDGYTVARIDDSVFEDNTRLIMVEIPDTVTEIGSYAFWGCRNLADVKLSKSLVSLGDRAFVNCESLESIEIPKSLGDADEPFSGCANLKNVTFEGGTTKVAGSLFENCTGLEEITIPDTVTVIEGWAFKNCTNLKEVSLSDYITVIGQSAFEDCTNLKKVIIPDSVTEIGPGVFQNCVNLSDVKLSKSLMILGNSAFYNCKSLESIEIPKSLKEVERWDYYEMGVFGGCVNLKKVTFESGTTKIANDLFENCTGLEEITIPDTVTVIEEYAFENCYNLKKITISDYITVIGWSAFEDCTNLKKVIIPDSVTEIGPGVFQNCVNLSDVKLSKSLMILGNSAFYNCKSLESIEIPKSLKEVERWDYYEMGVFGGCANLKKVTFESGTTKIANDLFENCTGLEEITIPDTVTVIEASAFANCTNLNNVVLSNKLESIEGYVFKGCSSLAAIDIPDSVTDMGTYIFAGCASLASVKLPKGRINISDGTFQGCSALKNITLPETVTYIREYAFQNSGLEEIVLPDSLKTIEREAFDSNLSLKKVVFGSQLETIEYAAFYNCDSLPAVALPDSVTFLGEYCFAKSEVLKDVTLGSGITVIPAYAFHECPSIEKMVLPYRVETIESNAFTNCTKLTELTLPRAVKEIGSNAFSYPRKMTVYGVSGSYAQEWAGSVGAAFVKNDVSATQVVLNKSRITINKGGQAALSITVTPMDFTDEVVWRSSDTSVVTVTQDGIISAVGVGTATVKVTAGSVSASCQVTVVQQVTSVSLNRTSLTLSPLETFQLTASVYPADAQNKKIRWTSSEPAVVQVSANGFITAVSKGTAEITAQAEDGSGVKRSCSVTVSGNVCYADSVAQLESPHNYENNCNDIWSYTLSGKKKLEVVFDSRTEVESGYDYLYLYDGKGNLIGKYTGTALAGKTVAVEGDTVRIKLQSDSSTTAWGFKVTSVREMPDPSIRLTSGSATLQVGKTTTIKTASIYPASDTVTYQSSDAKIAAVDSAGKVTAKSVGTAKITVTTKSGAKAVFTVKVTDLKLKVSSGNVQVGKTTTIRIASRYPSKDSVTYKSSNTKVAVVDSAGKVTAKSVGMAKITVTTKSGAKAVFTVKVTDLKLKKSSGNVQVGKTTTIQIASRYPSKDSVTYKSSNTKIATVNSAGKVTAKSVGTAKITVTTKSGAKAVFTVKVTDLKLKESGASIRVGKTTKIQIASRYPSKDPVTYKSSNTKIAAVNSKGKVTAKSAGTAKITVTTKSGAKAVFTVKVIK